MSTELVGAITEIDGRKPTEIDPIGWSIDLDAVDALTVDENDDLRITFSTNGYQVQIEGSRRILVRKASQED
ncbi:HalOD1 output domain-containing protein [Natronorarus salvus]|uniref:HalOD1 output domain-containing protein n=1 Tax=Natronorarus salvus TaxID=3117733 RepID=UPI002F262CBB